MAGMSRMDRGEPQFPEAMGRKDVSFQRVSYQGEEAPQAGAHSLSP